MRINIIFATLGGVIYVSSLTFRFFFIHAKQHLKGTMLSLMMTHVK